MGTHDATRSSPFVLLCIILLAAGFFGKFVLVGLEAVRETRETPVVYPVQAKKNIVERESSASLVQPSSPNDYWRTTATEPPATTTAPIAVFPPRPPADYNSSDDVSGSSTSVERISRAVQPYNPPVQTDRTISGYGQAQTQSAGSNYSSEAVMGHTPTGFPLHVGPKGGVYHYSKNGNKVYERRRK